MKRFIALLLAIVMINTFTVTGFAADPAVITVSSAEYVLDSDEKIKEITVSIDGNPGFAAFDLIVDYDDSQFVLKEFVNGSALTGMLVAPNPAEGLISVTGLADVVTNDVLFTLKFEVKDTVTVGKKEVSISGSMYNSVYEEVLFTVVPGGVTVVCTDHDFQSIVDDKYLDTEHPATCEVQPTYFKSCSKCGAKGSETFVDTNGEFAPHDFTVEKATAEYLKDEPNCNSKAVYYKSCSVCEISAKGIDETATFEGAVDSDKHKPAVDWSNETVENVQYHYHVCENECGTKLHREACSGGTATCTAKAVCSVCGKEYGDLLPHVYDKKVATEAYKATDATCTAKATYYYSCVCEKAGEDTFEDGEMLDHDFTAEKVANEYIVGEATCGSPATYYKSCSVCGKSSNDLTKTFTNGEPLEHDYKVTYGEWTKGVDGWELTATAECQRESCNEAIEGHIVTATANVAPEVTTEPTCEKMGKTTYTATFDVVWAETKTHEVEDVPAVEHNYENAPVSYKWTETKDGDKVTGYTACEAIRYCQNECCDVDGGKAEIEKVTLTTKIKGATCETEEVTTYTAYFSNIDWAETQSKELVTGDKLGHDFGETDYDWAEDGSSCEAKRQCVRANCNVAGGKVETADAEVNGIVTKEPTCAEEGNTRYTATFGVDWAETQTKDIAIPVDDDAHDWSVSYNWSEDGLACTATHVCANDATHNETADAEVNGIVTKEPTCTLPGDTQYTATFDVDWAETQYTVRTDVAVNPDAHDWGAWKVTEYPTYGEAGEEARVCVNDDTHVQTKEIPALEMPKQEEMDKVVVDDKEYYVGEQVIDPENTDEVPKEIKDETDLGKDKVKVSFVGVIIGEYNDAGEFEKVKATVTIGFPEGADSNDDFEVYVIDANGNITRLANKPTVTEDGIEVEVDGSATFAIAYVENDNNNWPNFPNWPNRPNRPSRPGSSSGEGITIIDGLDKEESNPNTGAPLMGIIPAIVVAAAAVSFKKRH
ncbi:MAG: hypothetical protein IJA05_03715 [Oscillospiraceae bacterium]|nr:hypothetical protein [Oscillospiraceae bacterium]